MSLNKFPLTIVEWLRAKVMNNPRYLENLINTANYKAIEAKYQHYLNLQIAKYPPSKGGSLVDEDVLSVIAKQVKTHKESIEMFEKAGRKDLVDRENTELAILQSYMPEQIGEEEVKNKIAEIIKNNPQADFGTLMKLAMGELKGKADGGVVAKFVKGVLA